MAIWCLPGLLRLLRGWYNIAFRGCLVVGGCGGMVDFGGGVGIMVILAAGELMLTGWVRVL